MTRNHRLSQTLFPGLPGWAVVALALLAILPHYLNDFYIVYLNKAYVTYLRVDGRWVLQSLRIGKWVMWTLDLAVYLTLPVLALWLYVRKGWFSWQAFDFPTERPGKDILIGLLLFAALWLAFFFKAFQWDPWLRDLVPRAGYFAFFYTPRDGWLPYILMSLYLGLAAGFLEEFLYRSFLIRALERAGLATWQAGVASVVLFVFIHAVAGAHLWVGALLAGTVFTLYYIRYRNIVPLVTAHAAIDIAWISGLGDRLAGPLARWLGLA